MSDFQIKLDNDHSFDRPYSLYVTHNDHQWTSVSFADLEELRALYFKLGNYIQEEDAREEMHFRCQSCGAHVSSDEVETITVDTGTGWGPLVFDDPVCPYCGEHELTSIEGEDEPR